MQKISQCKDFLCKTPFSTKTKISGYAFFTVDSAQCRTIIVISLYILAVNDTELELKNKILQDCAEIKVFLSEQAA